MGVRRVDKKKSNQNKKPKQNKNKNKKQNKTKKQCQGIRYYEHIAKPFRTFYGIVRGKVQKKASNQVVGCIGNDLKML